jgi:FkbM family methyltransferase
MSAARRRRWLRAARQVLAAAIAAIVGVFPSLETLVVETGRRASRKYRLFAGLYWSVQESLLARLRRGGDRFRTVTVLGREMRLDITEATGRYPYFYRSAYEPAVTDAIVTALRPGDVFIDVGAHAGYFTVLAARIVAPRGHVVAFEPHEGARDALERTVQRNEMSAWVDVVPAALADSDGSGVLFVDNEASSRSTLEPNLSPARQSGAFRAGATVTTMAFDSWMVARPDLSERVRCVKIDVQGAEGRVLSGMRDLLRRRGLTILCATFAGSQADTILTNAGFQRRHIEPGAPASGNLLYVRP